MKKKIRKVHDYFRTQLLYGKIKMEQPKDRRIINILIDNEYRFCLWTGSGEYGIKTYTCGENESFMMLDFSANDKKNIWNRIKDLVNTCKKETEPVLKGSAHSGEVIKEIPSFGEIYDLYL